MRLTAATKDVQYKIQMTQNTYNEKYRLQMKNKYTNNTNLH